LPEALYVQSEPSASEVKTNGTPTQKQRKGSDPRSRKPIENGT